MKKFLIPFVAMCAVLVLQLAGCGTMERHETTAKLAVTYATLKGVEQGLNPVRVRAVAESAKAVVSGEAVTLPALQEAIATELAGLDLSPADRMLAGILVQAIADELQLRLGTGILDPEQKVKVSQVLQWVIEATYLGSAAKTGPEAPGFMRAHFKAQLNA